MKYAIEEDILPKLNWNHINANQSKDQNVEIYYFSLTTCVYCRKGMNFLKDKRAFFKWLYLDEIPQEERNAIKDWIQKKYNLKSRMASPFVIFRFEKRDYISNGYDPEYWKTKIK
jgi:glutaredoxin